MLSDSNASSAKLAKNKNRQDAARKRVRDQNGKFQGGLCYRRPRIIFAIEKVARDTIPVHIYEETSTDSNQSSEIQVNFVDDQKVREDDSNKEMTDVQIWLTTPERQEFNRTRRLLNSSFRNTQDTPLSSSLLSHGRSRSAEA